MTLGPGGGVGVGVGGVGVRGGWVGWGGVKDGKGVETSSQFACLSGKEFDGKWFATHQTPGFGW